MTTPHDAPHDGHEPDPLDAALDSTLDALLRDARRSYNAPDTLPQTEAMWSAIERSLAAEGRAAQTVDLTARQLRIVRDVVPGHGARRWWQSPRATNPWLRTAAVLLIGVAIGRVSTRPPSNGAAPAAVAAAVTVAVAPFAAADSTMRSAEQVATGEYLGRTQALLAALPSELRAPGADPAYLTRADALLLETRLLLDSPASADPALRALFDDLELVLAQIVRLRGRQDSTDVDFLHQALEQRDVLPRLRDAVADNPATLAVSAASADD